MVCGIYCYRDLNNHGKIVYIGKDSYIDTNERDKDHRASYNYDAQKINRVLQNNPNRYEYQVLRTGDFNENLLSVLEILYIKRYGTYDNRKGYGESYGFNFTVGGDGFRGNHSDETKRKISESLKGNEPWNKGKTLSEEHKCNLSESCKGKTLSDETKRKIGENNARYWKGKTRPKETIRKMSESHKNKYASIFKSGKTSYGKQKYSIRKDGKIIKTSIYPSKLLQWFIEEFPKEILQIKINLEDKNDK